MEIVEKHLNGVLLLKPRVFEDARGYFYESFNAETLKKIGIYDLFIQDNQSLSGANVVRGLHFQAPPYAQAKLVRVINGAVIDVVVDIRKGSPTYGQHYAVRLDATNKLMLYVPKGFAHGFTTLEDNTLFFYKCTEYYNKQSEGGILWNDPELGIDWGTNSPILSEKDKVNPSIRIFNSPFHY